jgi:TfuA protein
MPEIIVFLGPSLDRESAREYCDGEYRPPAARGDILRAAADGARIIGLIDGVFFQECAVAHREILSVLRAGVKVIGASSMGALRAAELDTLGMEGVGEVYRLYKEGVLESDDEVALIFDPVYFIPASEPLVNIRCTVRRAREAGVIGRKCAEQLISRAQALYFPDRTYETILSVTWDMAIEEEIRRFSRFAETSPCDLKREDAIRALRRICEIAIQLRG